MECNETKKRMRLNIALPVFLVFALFYTAGTVTASDTIRVISTGVGVEQRIPEPSYSAKLVFSDRKSRALLADIHFVVSEQQSKAKILEMQSAGPWVYADLPLGSYTIKASRKDGKVQSARFTVSGKKQAMITLSW